jgi:tetratricopeptide (TPR) repeat protein
VIIRRLFRPSNVVPVAIIAAVAAVVACANWREARRSRFVKPADVAAAVQRADSLLRDARVTGNAGLAYRAEEVLEKALAEDPGNPGNYIVNRTLGAVYLAQHRFREAIEIAEKNRKERPYDAVNYGVIGDGHIELGDYTEAFDAFDRMMALRPSASAYARVAYARELQGNLTGALESMQLAAGATSPTDREGLAWARAQVGELYLQLGRVHDAKEAFTAASQAFPGHPFAVIGYTKVIAAEGDLARALHLLQDLQRKSPTPDLAARMGDLLIRLGRRDEAEQQYAIAEAAWRVDAPEPKNLARFLATHERKIDEVVTIAQHAAATRDDIFTDDALAWAYFKAGRQGDARRAIERALRTGTRDRDILAHAAAIRGQAPLTNVAWR